MKSKIVVFIVCLHLSCTIVDREDIHKTRGNIIFFNGLAETLSVLDIDEEISYNNVRTTGWVPNHLLYDSDLIVTNSFDNSVEIMNIDTLETVKEIDLGKGNNPWMTFAYNNYLYVSCFLTDQVIKADRVTGSILKTIPIIFNTNVEDKQDAPEGGVIYGNRLFIVNSKSDVISVIDLDSDNLIQYIELPESRIWNPQSILAINGEIHIVCTGVNNFTSGDGAVIIMDPNTYELKGTINIGGSPTFSEGSIDYSRKRVYLFGTQGISCYNYETYEVIETGIDDLFFSGLIYVESRDKLYASVFDADKIYIYRGEDFSYDKSVKTSDGPQQLLYITE